jgi:spore coat protein H
MKIRISFLLLFLFLLLFSGCKKIYEVPVDPEEEAFNFTVTDVQRQRINDSRGVQYVVTNPVPELSYAGKSYILDKFEIRGDNTLNFFRKGFGVNMSEKITLLDSDDQSERKYEEFKLLAMVYDYTYIENCVAVRLFKKVNLWPVNSFFTEVKLNNKSQGLYHFIEDPVEYFIKQMDASIVIRRGYDHVVKTYSANPASLADPQKNIERFSKIYSLIAVYSGQQLFDSLSAYMDLKQYFTKLSIDMIVKNGDYTDEVFFYTKTVNAKEIFGVFPWDYDDIFSDEPHEIGRPWGTGTVFGHREYSDMSDILKAVGSKLMFSIEDDLDYTIARDNILYQQYLKTLREVIVKIDPSTLDKIFDYTFEHIGPFYSDNEIIGQSRYDVNETNYDLFVSNLSEKRQMLKDRRNWILQELDKQKNN